MDSNKGIAWIKYNSLNLPSKIQFMNGNKTEYLYDATGMKREAKYSYALTQMQIPLGETATENTGSNLLSGSHTDYCGSYIYENDKINRILTPEGYIQTASTLPMNNMGKWKYTYFLKDHLGNTRAQLVCDTIGNHQSMAYSVAGTTDYYPFGMETSLSDGQLTSGTNPYLYNGKEMDRMNGLNMYDYGARWRGGDVPSWLTPDPLAEVYFSASPYIYCIDNPVINIDIDGRGVDDVNQLPEVVVTPSSNSIPSFTYYLSLFYYRENTYNTANNDVTNSATRQQGATNVLSDNAWRSQAPDWTGCFRTCCKIVGGIPSKSSAIYVAREFGKSLKILPDARTGVVTINSYLNSGKPIIVGVNHTFGLGYNEGTTDHYVVIMGSGQENGKTYYRFFDVGTTRQAAGASILNRLYLGSDNSLIGITQYNKATYTVSQVRPF